MTQTRVEEELSKDVMELVDFEGGAGEETKKAEEEPQQPLEDADKSQEETKKKSNTKDQANGKSEKKGKIATRKAVVDDEYEVEAIVDHKKLKVKYV
jgi:hypothetical protein